MNKTILPSTFYDFTIPGGETINIPVIGEYFKLMSATAPVDVRASWGELRSLTTGQGLENTPFDRLTVRNTSGSSNTVRLFVGDRNFIDAIGGSVSATLTGVVKKAVGMVPVTVTNSSTSIIGGNSLREYIGIQNKSLTGNIWIAFGGASATTTNGLKLEPGAFWESGFLCPISQVFAIGDIASNPDVIVMLA